MLSLRDSQEKFVFSVTFKLILKTEKKKSEKELNFISFSSSSRFKQFIGAGVESVTKHDERWREWKWGGEFIHMEDDSDIHCETAKSETNMRNDWDSTSGGLLEFLLLFSLNFIFIR